MHVRLAVTLSGLIIMLSLTASAWAGNISSSNGQPVWQSSACNVPVEPPLLSQIDREAEASQVNALIEKYNVYAQTVQAYMNCVSKEAQNDQGAISNAITSSAQATIDRAYNRLQEIRQQLKPNDGEDPMRKPVVTVQ